MYLDLRLGAHHILMWVLIYLTLTVHFLLWTGFFKSTALPRTAWMPITGFFAFCIFCPNQHENLIWAFQWSFVAAFFFASAAFVALVWLENRGRPWAAIALATLFALMAESNVASGLLCWPILCVASLAMPFKLVHRLSIAVVSTAGIALYLRGYHSIGGHASPVDSLRHPAILLKYILFYFDHYIPGRGVIAGVIACLITALATVTFWRLYRRNDARLASLALGMTITFLLGTGIVTALGRINFGIEQAASSRYQTSVMLYWGCTFALLVLGAFHFRPQRELLFLNVVAIAIILLPIRSLPPVLHNAHASADMLSLAGQSLDVGVLDPLIQRTLIESMDHVLPATEYIHSLGQSVGPRIDVAVPAAAVSSPDSKACSGWFDGYTPLQRFSPGPAEVRAEGWAVGHHHPVDLVVIVNDQGRVLATSKLEFGRQDVLNVTHSRGLVGWRLYVPLTPATKGLHALGFINGRACPLSGPLPTQR
jgi:hypothetical protein